MVRVLHRIIMGGVVLFCIPGSLAASAVAVALACTAQASLVNLLHGVWIKSG
jgi:hypothetical protein